MMTLMRLTAVELIPIERITVVNPRVRNKKIFKEIVSNIAEIGLKRPITVARRETPTARDMTSSAARAGWRPIRLSANARSRHSSSTPTRRTAW